MIVAEILAADYRVIEKIKNDYAFGSSLLFGVKPTQYQQDFFNALKNGQACTLRWPRQAGKTLSLGIGANLLALTAKNKTIIVVSASMRQAQILRRKMNKPLNNMHQNLKRLLYRDLRKTSIETKTDSNIYFESCLSEDKLRGYTADAVFCDEIEYWPNAHYVYYDIIDPMFNTTSGFAVPTSTPKNKNGLFFELCNDKNYVQLHANIHDVFNQSVLTQKRYNMLTEKYKNGEISTATWQTEYMAEFFDDIGRLLQHDMLTKCISLDEKFAYYTKPVDMLQVSGFSQIIGDFFVGRDLGNIGDHTVLCVIEKLGGYYCLRHLKVFDLNTPDNEIIDYNNNLYQVFSIKDSMTDATFNPSFAEQLSAGGQIVKFSKPFKIETARIFSEHVGNENRRGDFVMPPKMPKLQEFIYALNSVNRDTLDTDKGEHSFNSDIFWATALALRCAVENKYGVIRRAGGR